jgi:hypothetical protein
VSTYGWYPDPGGRPGQFRYWDGTSWSEELTRDPGQPAPAGSNSEPPPNRAAGWWIAAVAAVVVVGLVVWAVIRVIPVLTGVDPLAPDGSASANFCAAGASQISASARPEKAGWVTSGHLSFPELGAPWLSPEVDNRVPFGIYGIEQTATDQSNYDGNGHSWVSSVMVADLASGDGFASSKIAAEVALKCVLGKYYSDTAVTKNEISAGAHSVDGHTGWLIEAQLSFEVSGLKAKGERAILLVVQVKADQYGMFYASVPDTSPDRLPEARQTLAALKVED